MQMIAESRQRPGKVLNVFGETIDDGPGLEGVARQPVHRSPVPLSQRTTKMEVFGTGIEAIDVLAPPERGGKAGLFGGAGGQDRADVRPGERAAGCPIPCGPRFPRQTRKAGRAEAAKRSAGPWAKSSSRPGPLRSRPLPSDLLRSNRHARP